MKKLCIKLLAKTYNLLIRSHNRYTYEKYRQKYNIPSNFKFNGGGILFYGEGKIIVGDNSYVGHSSQIQVSDGYKVQIGNNCQIGAYLKIWTESVQADFDFNKKKIPKKTGNIIIGNAVWIGTNVYIAPNVTIGDNSIIGANAVVVSDISPNAIYGGVPAKLIRYKNIEKE